MTSNETPIDQIPQTSQSAQTSQIPQTSRPVNRRALLAGGAAIAGIALLKADPAAATTGNMQFGDDNDAGSAETSLTSTNAVSTLAVLTNAVNGSALYAEVSQSGNPSHAVEAITYGPGHAISASVDNVTSSNAAVGAAHNGISATGVFVQSNAATNKPGVYGSTAGFGPGVFGGSYGTGIGVLGASETGAAGVRGNNFSSGPGVYGVNTGTGVGVWGASADSRGGWFSGGKAQVRLVPAAGAHPASGLAGDVFVDSAKRLWFCKGGANWVQLA
jgi:hypothetical protein